MDTLAAGAPQNMRDHAFLSFRAAGAKIGIA
jgi:hypothetical protein